MDKASLPEQSNRELPSREASGARSKQDHSHSIDISKSGIRATGLGVPAITLMFVVVVILIVFGVDLDVFGAAGRP